MNGIIVDLFAGGGGASIGIESAMGRKIDVAINHDGAALAVHAANHPDTLHLEADVWEAHPQDVCAGRPVDLLWASPDCTHHSNAKGDVPRKSSLRSLAWVVVRWAKEVRPKVICLENVREFRNWGPLGKRGRPLKSKKGHTFRAWLDALRKEGYHVEHQVLDASEFGAPTKRLRLFVVARCDGRPIVWPAITHCNPADMEGDLFLSRLKPWRTAAECIDWSIPCPSIFERKKDLAEKTQWRIAEGIRRYVFEHPHPFVIKVNHGVDSRTGTRVYSVDVPLTTVTAKGRGHAVTVPSLIKFRHDSRGASIDAPLPTVTSGGSNQKRPAGAGHALGLSMPSLIPMQHDNRARGVDDPLGTLVASGVKHAVVAAWMVKHFGGVYGQEIERPASTVTATDHHALAAAHLIRFRGTSERQVKNSGQDMRSPVPTVSAGGTHVGEVRAFLTKYYSTGAIGQEINTPAHTLTAKHRLGLVTVEGIDYQIADIGMRMLEPHELLAAQFGEFSRTYDLSAAKTKTAKVRLIGNSVCPDVAYALVAANCTEASSGVAA